MPTDRGKLKLLCPKCQHDWSWEPNGSLTQQIENIKLKVARLRQSHELENQNYGEFWASIQPNRAAFNFSPPLRASQLDAWEEKFKLFLPVEYRTFLEQIGNGGGEVHGYELLKLDIESMEPSAAQSALNYAKPCSISVDIAQEIVTANSKNEQVERWHQWLVQTVGKDWEALYDQELWSPTFGMLPLGCDFCGAACSLGLHGPLKGRIVHWLHEPGFAEMPCLDESAHFLDWYEAWLDQALQSATGQVMDNG
ncbi:MAG: SMI1/KNR4 family protein [Cyanobacteria bacterium P01_A01_bin.114]